MVILPGHLLDDLHRRIEGAVCCDALDVLGQAVHGAHQYGSRAHGDAHQADLYAGAEAADRVVDPALAVLMFLHAEGDGAAFALACGSLLGHQHVISHIHQHAGTAGKVPGGGAAVAVDADA